MKLSTVLAGQSFQFGSVKEVLAKANEEVWRRACRKSPRSRDSSALPRRSFAARLKRPGDLRENPVVAYEGR